jgi:hypothetical protein
MFQNKDCFQEQLLLWLALGFDFCICVLLVVMNNFIHVNQRIHSVIDLRNRNRPVQYSLVIPNLSWIIRKNRKI